MDLVYGTVRWRRTLEWALSRLMRRLPEGPTRAALLVGAYQVLFMPDVPAYAAVSATVDAAKIDSGRSTALINGVLRNLVRRRDEIMKERAAQPLGIRQSHPDALLSRWEARYGAADTDALCRWNNTPAETVVAGLPEANTQHPTSNAQHPTAPAASAFSLPPSAFPPPPSTVHPPPILQPHPAAPETCFIVPHGLRVEQVPGFGEGAWVVQDPATLVAVRLLDARPGQTVWDACAAPGGKTARIACAMRGHGRLIAMDLHADRLPTLRSTLVRTHQEWVEIVEGDASQPLPADWPRFDRILVDAPCSNTGVLRRRPDARWRFSQRRLEKLIAIQQHLLLNLLQHLAPGGRLVYSTCSLEPEENLRLVERVLEQVNPARLETWEERLPFRDGTDGAFAAAIVLR